MKSLSRYILEKSEVNENVKVQDLTVTYRASHGNITLEVPNTFSEDDLQMYIDSLATSKNCILSNDTVKDLLGDNYNKISDAYFKYSRYISSDLAPATITVKYDSANSDKDTTVENTELVYYTIYDVEYIINFESFNLANIDHANLHEEIDNIFKTFESNNINKYFIELKYKKCTYTE